MSFMNDFEHLKIQLKDIRAATNDFGDKPVGIGGFGKVYKGELSLPEGRTIVAFKRLDRKHGQGDTEFWKEIMMLSQCRHENLVSLIRFCNEDGERILVYEYASRGSLDRYLSDTSLTWTQRLKICLGAARGLNYLHDPMNTQQRVLHRDIKSSNILLDEKLTAKVSDFGLSKIGPANQEHTYLVSNVVGTPGYCDPLYWETGFLSKESDVYSFGVVLFEVMCGRLCFEYCDGEFHVLVSTWKKCYDENRLDDIISHDLKEQIDLDSLIAFSSIANQCLNRGAKERPTMAEIIKKLEVALEQQEISRDEEERIKYEERKRMANCAATRLSYRSRNELLLLLSEGILLDDGKTWFSINKKGENCEMISSRECTFTHPSHHRWQHETRVYGSRFQMSTSCFWLDSKFQIEVNTRFLSPHVTYAINLLYRVDRHDGYQGQQIPFKYKLDEETKYSTLFVSQEKHNDWLSAELYQFTCYQKEHNFRIQFQSHSHHSRQGSKFYLEGIEFRPMEYENDGNLEKENMVDMQPIIDLDIDQEQNLPIDYAEIIKWSKDNMQWTTKKEIYYLFRKGFLINKSGEKWFSIGKNMKIRYMLPARAIFQEESTWKSLLRSKKWIWKSIPESRFDVVAGCSNIKSFDIVCEIETQLLSREETYAIYLVYKLPTSHSVFEGIVQLEEEERQRLIYMFTPPHTPIIRSKVDQESHIPLRTHKIKGHPKLRKDGWMEIQLTEYENYVVLNGNPMMHCRLSTYDELDKMEFTGLLVQGVEFRPAKVSFSKLWFS